MPRSRTNRRNRRVFIKHKQQEVRISLDQQRKAEVECLLKLYPNVNGDIRLNFIMKAMSCGDIDTVLEIHKRYGDLEIRDGITIAHIAVRCKGGAIKILDALHKAGAPLDVKAVDGVSPIALAVLNDDATVVHMLENYDVDLDADTVHLILEHCSKKVTVAALKHGFDPLGKISRPKDSSLELDDVSNIDKVPIGYHVLNKYIDLVDDVMALETPSDDSAYAALCLFAARSKSDIRAFDVIRKKLGMGIDVCLPVILAHDADDGFFKAYVKANIGSKEINKSDIDGDTVLSVLCFCTDGTLDLTGFKMFEKHVDVLMAHPDFDVNKHMNAFKYGIEKNIKYMFDRILANKDFVLPDNALEMAMGSVNRYYCKSDGVFEFKEASATKRPSVKVVGSDDTWNPENFSDGDTVNMRTEYYVLALLGDSRLKLDMLDSGLNGKLEKMASQMSYDFDKLISEKWDEYFIDFQKTLK